MIYLRRHLSQGARAHFVVGLLLVTLGLTAVLAYQAQSSARSHHAAAINALEDHAAFVAWQFASRAQSKIDYKIGSPGFHYVEGADAVPRAACVPETGECEAPETPKRPSFLYTVFAVDLDGGDLIVFDGPALSEVIRSWLCDTLMIAARNVYDPEWSYAIVAGAPDGRSHVFFYRVEFSQDGSPRSVKGFEVRPVDKLYHPFELAYYEQPLLPPSLTAGADNASMLSVRVLGPAGDTLFAPEPQYPPGLTARDQLTMQFGQLPVEVALRPESADVLIIGGLPRSRLPLLVGLLLLAGGLVAAAIFLLRREVELARLRAEFVSNVSHELRTPLAQIRMFTETLLLGRVRSGEERERSLQIIDQEARRLSHLVSNILLFSRAERNGTRLNIAPTDLTPQIQEVLDGFRPLVAAKGVSISLEIGDELIAEVDRSAFRQIILNFLDNAVKYGPDGQMVTLGLREVDGYVRLWVDDEGPGVPQDRRDEVWKPFSRLDRERENATAGTGIGLSVVRELAAVHHGRAWVEDAPSGGARFVAELPLKSEGAAREWRADRRATATTRVELGSGSERIGER